MVVRAAHTDALRAMTRLDRPRRNPPVGEDAERSRAGRRWAVCRTALQLMSLVDSNGQSAVQCRIRIKAPPPEWRHPEADNGWGSGQELSDSDQGGTP
jgi:hypothetical protein